MSGAILSGIVALKRAAGAAALTGLMAALPDGQARAQGGSMTLLPALNVTASRLFGGITGTSTTVITAEDIERAPQMTLVDILSREAGVQTSSLYNGVNGVGTTVDLRGFGITGASNTLVLVNGRRLNDWDITGADLSAIPRNSIERIEITRGNSGAVLYGDGAVGGVINIVTKSGAGAKPSARIEGGFGSFNGREGNAGVTAGSGPFSIAAYGNAVRSDGYRDNNEIRRLNGVGEIRYNAEQGSAFFNIAADDLRTRTPGPRIYSPTLGLNEPVTDRRGTSTPFDFGDKQSVNLTAGFTRTLWTGGELIVDGGHRKKDTQFGTFDPVGGPYGYNDTTLTTSSITPRLRIEQNLFGLPTQILTGVDLYRTEYDSARSAYQGAAPRHRYLLDNDSVAAYWQQTVSILPTTDISFGGRVQRDSTSGRDAFDPSAPNGPLGTGSTGLSLDKDQTNRAYHVGLEHRFTDGFAVFGRLAQSFRVPNVDERVGVSPVNTVTNFDIRTQKSHDQEVGVRFRFGNVNIQSSVYDMRLTDELHFSPITFANVNLDPTRRQGVETVATWQVSDALRLRGNLTYTRARYREGPFEGKAVPVVSPWTGSANAAWNIWQRYLMLDTTVRYVGERFLDQDEANRGDVKIPSYTVWDARLSGEIDRFFWSVAVQNIFDKKYFDYGIDQSGGGFYYFPIYPLAGRMFVVKAGVTW